MGSTGEARAILRRFESHIRDLHDGGETVCRDDLIDVINGTFEEIHRFVPEAEISLNRAMSQIRLCDNVMDQVRSIRERLGPDEEIVESVLQLDEPHLRRAVERSTNHKGDTLLRTALVELVFNLNRVINRVPTSDAQQLAETLDHSKSKVMELMHGSCKLTHRALTGHGGLLLRDYSGAAPSSHTVKYLGAHDCEAARIRGHVIWDDAGHPIFGPELFSIQASDYLTETELRQAAAILLYKFGLQQQSGHCVFLTSKKFRLHRQTAHVTVWSVHERIGRRFEVLLYPRKRVELLDARIA